MSSIIHRKFLFGGAITDKIFPKLIEIFFHKKGNTPTPSRTDHCQKGIILQTTTLFAQKNTVLWPIFKNTKEILLKLWNIIHGIFKKFLKNLQHKCSNRGKGGGGSNLIGNFPQIFLFFFSDDSPY